MTSIGAFLLCVVNSTAGPRVVEPAFHVSVTCPFLSPLMCKHLEGQLKTNLHLQRSIL